MEAGAKEQETLIWDFNQKVFEHEKYIKELEDSVNSKKKKKSKECLECKRKDIELDSLSQRLQKTAEDAVRKQADMQKEVRNKT